MMSTTLERSGRKVMPRSPIVEELRAALDTADREAKQAWTLFEAERQRLAEANVDLENDVEALKGFDDLHSEYRRKADLAEDLRGRWEAAIGEVKNGGGDVEQRGPGKLAKSILDRADAKALVQPSGTIVNPDLIPLIVDEALRDRSILPLYSRQRPAATRSATSRASLRRWPRRRSRQARSSRPASLRPRSSRRLSG